MTIKKIKIRKASSGFTLIEILIIVAVIAILAGVVLVAMNPTRRINQSNDSRRWEDITSISSALGQYIADNKGDVPNCGSDNIPSDGIYKCIGSGSGGMKDYTGIDESSLISWWNFENSNNLGLDGKSTNSLTNYTDLVTQNDESVINDFSADFDVSSYLYKDTGISYNSMTVSAWIKLRSDVGTLQKYGIAGTHNESQGWKFVIETSDPIVFKNVIAVYFDGNDHFAKTSLNINTWYHIAFTYDGTNLKIYINGAEDYIDSSAVAFTPVSEQFQIGKADNYFNGLMDEVAIFNRALSKTEVQEIFYYGLAGNRPCCDLSTDLNSYLHKMPEDPVGGTQNNTGYVIRRDPQGAMYIRAPRQSQETTNLIEVSR